ncbi:hypothetical protein SCP_0700550 [Sparassis crispa]|uniref:Uncharacterized protein n=1 Tax=Sparassis crispa TaxID=139825 RepID=A0A401GRM6_9APHY|nr:hypothetical protein SCP_0700550 [Sparassis crispa]GBE84875.1 hypothetical protein SCP_0700550 [Sparassis crispa]
MVARYIKMRHHLTHADHGQHGGVSFETNGHTGHVSRCSWSKATHGKIRRISRHSPAKPCASRDTISCRSGCVLWGTTRYLDRTLRQCLRCGPWQLGHNCGGS